MHLCVGTQELQERYRLSSTHIYRLCNILLLAGFSEYSKIGCRVDLMGGQAGVTDDMVRYGALYCALEWYMTIAGDWNFV